MNFSIIKPIMRVSIFIAAICLIIFFSRSFTTKKTKAPEFIANQIYTILDRYRITYDIDKHSVDDAADSSPQPITGIESCIKNLDNFIQNRQPIQMLLVGFPFKSANHEKKTLSFLPDMAERRSFEYLQSLSNAITEIYSPGVVITIFCDGIPFAEFFGIPYQDVIAYERALEQLAADLPSIRIYSSANIAHTHGITRQEINTFFDAYPPNDQEFTRNVPKLPQTAIKRFALELDHQHGKQLIARSSLEIIVRSVLAREMRLRSYIADQFPTSQFFRLTAHFSNDVSKKFGIKLSPTSLITPYHGVLVQNEISWSIQFKKDIDLSHYELTNTTINGLNCPYFKRKKQQ